MRHLIRAGNVVSLVVAAILGWAFYSLVFDNEPPIAITDTFVINSQPVPPNAVLRIRYAVTILRACPGEGRRIFVDAGGVQYPTAPFATNTGVRADGQKTFANDMFDDEIEVPVPNSAAPGHASYTGHAIFFCNIWQHLLRRGIAFDYPTVGFEIGGTPLPHVEPTKPLFKHEGRGRADRFGMWLRGRFGFTLASDED